MLTGPSLHKKIRSAAYFCCALGIVSAMPALCSESFNIGDCIILFVTALLVSVLAFGFVGMIHRWAPTKAGSRQLWHGVCIAAVATLLLTPGRSDTTASALTLYLIACVYFLIGIGYMLARDN